MAGIRQGPLDDGAVFRVPAIGSGLDTSFSTQSGLGGFVPLSILCFWGSIFFIFDLNVVAFVLCFTENKGQNRINKTENVQSAHELS